MYPDNNNSPAGLEELNDAEALNKKGEALLANEQFGEAVLFFSKAIALNDTFSEAYQNRGQALSELGQRDQALADFHQAALHEISLPYNFKELEQQRREATNDIVGPEDLISDLNLAEAYNERGEEYLKKNLYQRAQADFSRALELNPDLVTAYMNRASAAMCADDLQTAIDDFGAVVSREPDNVLAFNQRGIAHQQLGLLKDAELDFSRAIDIDPDFGDAYVNRAELYEKLGRKGLAEADRNKAFILGSFQSSKVCHREKYTEEIFDVFEEMFPDGDDPFSTGSKKQRDPSPVVLEFADGNSEDARVVLFEPDASQVTVLGEDGQDNRVLPVDGFNCILIGIKPPELVGVHGPFHAEKILTNDGKVYHARVPDAQSCDNGFFALSTKEVTTYKYFFFPHANIKFRSQKRYLGQILVEKGMISNADFERAIQEQQGLKKRKLGELIAEQANILNEVVEREIDRAYRDREEGEQVRVGDILLSAGLVDAEQVNAALQIQQKIKKTKIGDYLIEKGLLREEDVFVALAEKFKIPYVDLRQTTISRKALNTVPREWAMKLRILPLAFKGADLVIAITEPGIPEMKDYLRKLTKHKVHLVLARTSHLKAAIRKLYQAEPVG